MRALAGLLALVALLSACGAPFGDGAPPPTPLSVAGVASAVNPNATATRSAASATRATASATRSTSTVVSTRTVTTTAPIVATRGTATPLPVLPTSSPMPARPGPPATPSANATPGTPRAATPSIATPGISGTPGTPRAATPSGNATSGATPRAATLGTPGLAGSPVAATPGASSPTGTAIQIFAPYRPDGLVSSLRVSGTVNGYCLAGSEPLPGRPDAWRCATGGRILDPCFASATPDTAPLACAASPWSAEITLLALTAPLPRDRANANFDVAHAPWAFQLASGVRCQTITGSTGMIIGMQVSAACSDGSQIVGMPDRSGGHWRVYVMRDNSPSLEEQEIVAAWY